MLTRREIVGGLVGLAVLGARAASAQRTLPLYKPLRGALEGPLRKALFGPLVGETFTASSDTERVWIELFRIQDGPPSKVTEQFTLVFRGPHQPALPDGSYTVAHHIAGSTLMYFKLIGHDAYNVYYEAPFNLLL
jgi:hypothetical protein